MRTEEILNECKDIVEELCLKYGYGSEDKEGSASLKTVLLKVIPAMIKDSKPEDKALFYQMLINILEQKCNMNMIRYNMGIDNYKAFLDRLGYEGYSLINQAALVLLKKEQESLNGIRTSTKITPSSAAKNALAQGTTTDQVSQAKYFEYSKQNSEHIKEGKTKDD